MSEPSLAIIGGESLLGREVRELLSERSISSRLKLIGAEEETEGIFSEAQGEAVVITKLDEENLAGAELAFLAGPTASSRKALELSAKTNPHPALIDLTHGLEEQPNARLRAPMVEPAGYEVPNDAVHSIAHPAAIVLALFFNRLQERHPIRRSIVQVFEPASERGKSGLNELQQQTVNLLSFKNLDKNVFDEQLSFNMLPRYGSEAPEALEAVELRIDRHLATLLAMTGRTPMPSLRLSQTPVFHGYSFSVWVEFDEKPDLEKIGKDLDSALIELRGTDVAPPTNVGAAGQVGITVGTVEADRNDPRAAWFWIVADNLRIAAENAVLVAESVLAKRKA